MLQDFITSHRAEIITRCLARVASRPQYASPEALVNSGVPTFLDQLVSALETPEQPHPDIATTAARHGHDLLVKGFTVSQVVHDYGDVCQTITALALEHNAPITTGDFRILNRCLDEAIAGAVTVYGRESAQNSLDGALQGSERLGFLVHELRNLVHTAIIAFEVIKKGTVGVDGSTAAVLSRSLANLRDLVARSLDEARISAGIQHKEQILVSELIAQIAHGATLEGTSRGRTLVVAPVEPGVTVEADYKVLSAVVVNLIQNAFKFSPLHSTIRLEVGASAGRVLIEVHDECGGLPGGGDPRDFFRPFEQRGADRTGVGIGLAFCRWGAEANNGRLYARNLPGTGCVFTVDLPRSVAAIA